MHELGLCVQKQNKTLLHMTKFTEEIQLLLVELQYSIKFRTQNVSKCYA